VDCGVPPGEVAPGLGEALAAWVGVEGTEVVAAKLGMEVAVGARESVWVTCAHTVAATSVRKGSRSRVGVLVGVEVLQAAMLIKHRHTPIRLAVLIVWVIWLFLCPGGWEHDPPGESPELILRWQAKIVKSLLHEFYFIIGA